MFSFYTALTHSTRSLNMETNVNGGARRVRGDEHKQIVTKLQRRPRTSSHMHSRQRSIRIRDTRTFGNRERRVRGTYYVQTILKYVRSQAMTKFVAVTSNGGRAVNIIYARECKNSASSHRLCASRTTYAPRPRKVLCDAFMFRSFVITGPLEKLA